MNITINKKALIKGDKGDKGETPEDITVPNAGLIAIEGDIPEGYILYKEVDEGASE